MVLGEARDEDMDSYLGLRFPPSDIPQMVRTMFCKLPMRYFPDVAANSVEIISNTNAATNSSLDLSVVNLREIVPTHAQYVKKMGVNSTVSLAILQDNKLWGLIICHHKEAKSLSLELRLYLLVIANSVSDKLLAIERLINFEEEKKSFKLKTTVSSQFEESQSLLLSLKNHHKQMLQLVGATGMSLYENNSLHNYGKTPTKEQIRELLFWLKTKDLSTPYASSELPLEHEPSKFYKDKACGLLAIRIVDNLDKYLLFYKPESIQTITWAGNPHEDLKSDGSLYSPRTSFRRFTEQMTDKSYSWKKSEIKSAIFIESIIIKKRFQELLATNLQDEKLQMVTQLASGFAHEINNPLSYVINNMHLISRRINKTQQLVALCNKLKEAINSSQTAGTQSECENIFSFVQKSNISANLADLNNLITESNQGLQKINEIINHLKSLGIDKNESAQDIDINKCIFSAISLTKEQSVSEFNVQLNLSDLPSFKGILNKIQTVFITILKTFIRTFENKSVIIITSSLNEDNIVINFIDKNNCTNKLDLKDIFKPFSNPNSIDLHKELNMPLAYAIVKLHNGDISAACTPDAGIVFTIQLPVNTADEKLFSSS